MEITNETIQLYKKRVANCIKAANMSKKDTWAYNFWMQTASKITKKLEIKIRLTPETNTVAIHEDRPAGISRQIRREEPREGEFGGLQRVHIAPIQPAQVLQRDWRDRDRR